MKRLILLCIALNAVIFSHAQTISLPENNEYCPNNDLTFAVINLPGTYIRMESSGGATYWGDFASGSTLFFTGKFADINANQTFTVFFVGGAGSKTFTYKKVRSLLYPSTVGTSCASVPATPINAPLCQTSDISYSFFSVEFCQSVRESVFEWYDISI